MAASIFVGLTESIVAQPRSMKNVGLRAFGVFGSVAPGGVNNILIINRDPGD